MNLIAWLKSLSEPPKPFSWRWRRKTMRELRKKYPRGTEMRKFMIATDYHYIKQAANEMEWAEFYEDKQWLREHGHKKESWN